MKDEFEKHASEFKNEDDIEEEFDSEQKSYEKAEKEHYDLEQQYSSSERGKFKGKYEEKFNKLIEQGISKEEAANIVDAERKKQWREEELRKSKLKKI